jgi:hypothetical protein
MGGRLGSVAVGAASCRGFASRRAACTLPILAAGADTRKSLEASSYRPSDSGISLQIRPKASEKTRRMQNLPRNRIGNELPFLANPTLELRHDLRLQYSAQFSPSIRMLARNEYASVFGGDVWCRRVTACLEPPPRPPQPAAKPAQPQQPVPAPAPASASTPPPASKPTASDSSQ